MVLLELYIDLEKFFSKNHRKYKEQMLKEIVADFCALTNGSGGEIMFSFNKMQKNTTRGIDSFLRSVEQSCINIVGTQMAVLNLDRRIVCNNVVCTVKKGASLITTHYNLYLPTTTQVVSVPSTENIKDNILNRQYIAEPVKRGSHHKRFVTHTFCNVTEDKQTQLKLLENSAKNSTKFVQRMMNNKFTAYASAFANHNGGHIYYGITDDGVVAGEKVPDEDISEISKKVEKVIKKMIWSDRIGQPKQGEHWDIFFEPVVDENSKPIPSTYVIVIYIAPCLGGVFTEAPECYEMVEGKVCKMSFSSWKKTILGPDGVNATEHFMFQLLSLCEHAEVVHAKGNLHRVPVYLEGALAKAEFGSPGLVSGLVYLFHAGTIMELFHLYLRPPDEFAHHALQHLQRAMLEYPEVDTNLKNKVHINLAAFHLGCRLSGELVDGHIDESRMSQANCSIIAIEQSKCQLTHYRKVQLNLVKSIYYFRCSQNQPEDRMRFLRQAFEFSEKSENLARKCRFFEMVSWNKSLQGLITEKLVRATFGERRIMNR